MTEREIIVNLLAEKAIELRDDPNVSQVEAIESCMTLLMDLYELLEAEKHET